MNVLSFNTDIDTFAKSIGETYHYRYFHTPSSAATVNYRIMIDTLIQFWSGRLPCGGRRVVRVWRERNYRLNRPQNVAAAKYRKCGIEISSQKSFGDTFIDISFQRYQR